MTGRGRACARGPGPGGAASPPPRSRWRPGRGLPPLFALAALAACDKNKQETTWIQFNADDQTLVVEVLPEGSPVGDPIEIVLMSNLRRTEVGVAAVTPGSGPVGTEHLLTVDVADAWEEIVGRVTVVVDSEAVKDLDGDGEPDSRGEGEFELLHDSADLGAWALSLQSLGAKDETRDDRFEVVLWQPEDLDLPTTEATE